MRLSEGMHPRLIKVQKGTSKINHYVAVLGVIKGNDVGNLSIMS